MKPSQVDQIIPHADHYLSGAGVEPTTLSLENVWKLAYSEIESQLRTIAKEEIRDSYDEVEISHLQGELDSVDFQPFLFPVWVAEYVYKSDDEFNEGFSFDPFAVEHQQKLEVLNWILSYFVA